MSEVRVGRFPSVFIIGFPKCGTTAVHNILLQHLDVSEARQHRTYNTGTPLRTAKEQYFFSADGYFNDGIDSYKSKFRADRMHAIESTPTYVLDQVAISRVSHHVPNAKIIVMLREPSARAFSAWLHWTRLPTEIRWEIPATAASFEENLDLEFERLADGTAGRGFLQDGIYIRHLQRLEKIIPREQILYCFSVELRLEFDITMERIQKFLGLDPIHFKFREINKQQDAETFLSQATRVEMRKFFRESDLALQDFLGRRLPWEI